MSLECPHLKPIKGGQCECWFEGDYAGVCEVGVNSNAICPYLLEQEEDEMERRELRSA